MLTLVYKSEQIPPIATFGHVEVRQNLKSCLCLRRNCQLFLDFFSYKVVLDAWAGGNFGKLSAIDFEAKFVITISGGLIGGRIRQGHESFH